ncbi:DNA repair protein XRCC1 [Fopius arisanus]|uniref:DNA repair protein XRCC1 n=2 Tax=Fopius arisanus TaxID=64838 RepID=A0A0C9R775_9HYME|nr:PREDICTED: DNA repair protein XRCC1 [Fopius arisanus]
MIIPISKIVSCSSEHPDFPVSNLLKNPPPGPWKCEKPGVLLTYVIFEFSEPMCITGLDISNYRSCIVIVTASTESDPDSWIPIVNHQFLSHDEAANNKFRDQVQLFTKKELNSETLKVKFNRAKVTCMQSANTKILFGLSSIILKGEAPLSMDLDVLGRFKLKPEASEKPKNDFKAKFLRLFPEKQKDYREEIKEKIKENGLGDFNKRQEAGGTPKRRPLLEKLEAGKSEEVFGKKKDNEEKDAKRTPFGDVIPEVKENSTKKKDPKQHSSLLLDDNEAKKKVKVKTKDKEESRPSTSKRRSHFLDSDGSDDPDVDDSEKKNNKKTNGPKKGPSAQDKGMKGESPRGKCSVCQGKVQDRPCLNCNKLPKQKPVKFPQPKKPRVEEKKKAFSKLMDDISFSLSGYVNPQRDEIRRKALKMGARYVADPNVTSNKCTHLICAFQNTPKSQQLKGHSKIVSHLFIEEAFDNEKRFPWRRYAMDKSDRKQPESEEEVEGTDSPIPPPNPYDQQTDPESEEDY